MKLVLVLGLDLFRSENRQSTVHLYVSFPLHVSRARTPWKPASILASRQRSESAEGHQFSDY